MIDGALSVGNSSNGQGSLVLSYAFTYREVLEFEYDCRLSKVGARDAILY